MKAKTATRTALMFGHRHLGWSGKHGLRAHNRVHRASRHAEDGDATTPTHCSMMHATAIGSHARLCARVGLRLWSFIAPLNFFRTWTFSTGRHYGRHARKLVALASATAHTARGTTCPMSALPALRRCVRVHHVRRLSRPLRPALYLLWRPLMRLPMSPLMHPLLRLPR